MKTQEMVMVGLVAIMLLAVGYFAFTANDNNKTTGNEKLFFKALEMGKGVNDYYYSYKETTNNYPKTYTLHVKDDIKKATIQSPLSTKEVYFTPNKTIFCMRYNGEMNCSDVSTNQNLANYLASIKGMFYDDAKITTWVSDSKYRLDKGYLRIGNKTTKKTVNGKECNAFNYKIDYNTITINDATKFGVMPGSPTLFNFSWCVEEKTDNLLEQILKYDYNGKKYVVDKKVIAVEWNTDKLISVPTELSGDNAVSRLYTEAQYSGRVIKCYEKTGDKKDECIMNVAIEATHVGICAEAGGKKDACYVALAAIKLKPSICLNITNQDYKENCYIELGGGLKNSTWCENITNNSKKEFCQNVSKMITPVITYNQNTSSNGTSSETMQNLLNVLENDTNNTTS